MTVLYPLPDDTDYLLGRFFVMNKVSLFADKYDDNGAHVFLNATITACFNDVPSLGLASCHA
jgi:hypothetical protein